MDCSTPGFPVPQFSSVQSLSHVWLFFFFTLQYCIGFAIHQHASAMGIHVVPILNPPTTSLMSNSLWLHESQHARPPCPSPTPGVHPNSCPSSRWCHPAISSSVVPFSCPNPSQHQGLFQWVNSSHEVAKLLEFQLQHHSFQRNPRADLLQNGLVGSPCSPRDSQESSATPQFRSINSSARSFLHSPTLTSIHDHRKNHSLD